MSNILGDESPPESPPQSPQWPRSLSNFPLSLRPQSHLRTVGLPPHIVSSPEMSFSAEFLPPFGSFPRPPDFLARSGATSAQTAPLSYPSFFGQGELGEIEAQIPLYRASRGSGQLLETMARGQASENKSSKDKGPVVTLDSALPAIPYKDEDDSYRDQDDSKGKKKTLAYFRTQRHILKYLRTRAADAVSAHRVASWTEEIDSTDEKEPAAVEALRLCYYMRSQGFDVYPRFVTQQMLCLYVVNQTTSIRSRETDTLYWRQNIATDEIQYSASSSRHSRRYIDARLGTFHNGRSDPFFLQHRPRPSNVTSEVQQREQRELLQRFFTTERSLAREQLNLQSETGVLDTVQAVSMSH